MNICPVGAELFHADRRTHRRDGANGDFRATFRILHQKHGVAKN